ncbi:MAG TPA: phosphoribosylglycinamide formyltransferase [Thermotogota bacterium]|nr:phosphoribosylglycinamide formyltransferase [Thermotogota bacterium]HPJ88960.1 phosphoribosylglycinamide formyltransferase [Thermotogota bacterium]HPR95902.1 phosphoribosylglycinamide formyltransferase [Thermotogota bacterium]
MLNIAVLVSGGGTNLQAIIDYTSREAVDASVEVVISDREAYALERAEAAGIKGVLLDRKVYGNRLSDEIYKLVKDCDLIILAGYLSILDGKILEVFSGRMINIHPSLIPSFCGPGMYGRRVHKAAIRRGVKVSGCTVHIVDSGTDTGPILIQKVVEVKADDTPETLAARILPFEHVAICEALQLFVDKWPN